MTDPEPTPEDLEKSAWLCATHSSEGVACHFARVRAEARAAALEEAAAVCDSRGDDESDGRQWVAHGCAEAIRALKSP